MLRIPTGLPRACLGLIALLTVLSQSSSAVSYSAADLFRRGRSFDAFLATVGAQRDLWRTNTARAEPPRELVDRLEHAARGLRVLVVAEDWCPDSANTVPYIARLASRAGVPLRIVDRTDGKELMTRHPASDGRGVTPTVILLRDGLEAGAWVERPVPLQRMFHSMATDPESARAFAGRQAWYDADRGQTTIGEFVALAERAVRERP